MLKLMIFVFVVSMVKNTVDAAVGVIALQNKLDKHDYIIGCYLKDFDIVLPYNGTIYSKDGSCVKYTCKYDGYVSINSCKAVYEGSCLRIAGNRSLNYPECCDSIDCRNRKQKPISIPQTVKAPNKDDQGIEEEYYDEEEVSEFQTNNKVQNNTLNQISIPNKQSTQQNTNKTVIVPKAPTITNNTTTKNISKASVKEEIKKETNVKKDVVVNKSTVSKNSSTDLKNSTVNKNSSTGLKMPTKELPPKIIENKNSTVNKNSSTSLKMPTKELPPKIIENKNFTVNKNSSTSLKMPTKEASPKVIVENKTKTPEIPLKTNPNERKPVTPTVNPKPTQYIPNSKDPSSKSANIKTATSKLIEQESKPTGTFLKPKVITESKGTSPITKPAVVAPGIKSDNKNTTNKKP